MTMNKFMADVDDLIFDGQEQSHSERYKTGRTTPRGRGFFYAFLRVPKISTMRNRFSEIFRKRLRKNWKIISTLAYI